MLQNQEYKPLFDEFQNVKSLVSSPDLSRPKEFEKDDYRTKQKIEKQPFLSEQAKLLLEELHKYKTVYKPSDKDNNLSENDKRDIYISEKAKEIMDEFKFSQKNIKEGNGKLAQLTDKNVEKLRKENGSDINTNFYSLTEPFTFEARDFDGSKGSFQIKSNLENSTGNLKDSIEQPQVKQEIKESPKKSAKNPIRETIKESKHDKKTLSSPQKTPLKPLKEGTKFHKKETLSPTKPVMKSPENRSPLKKPPQKNMGNSKVLEVDLNINTTKSKLVKKDEPDSSSKPVKKIDIADNDKKSVNINNDIKLGLNKNNDKKQEVNNNDIDEKNKEEINVNQMKIPKKEMQIEERIRKFVQEQNFNLDNFKPKPMNFEFNSFQLNVPSSNTRISSLLNLNKSLSAVDKNKIESFANLNKIDSISNLNKQKSNDYQKNWSEEPKSIDSSSHNKELKMKGFQVQIDNIINNCFSNFIHRSFPASTPIKSKPSSASLAKPSDGYSQGFFSHEEKTRTLPPAIDNIGKEMEGILKRIKTEIAQKTENFAKTYHGESELKKSRFITEIQQAVKASLEELDSTPNSERPKQFSSHKALEQKFVQTGEKTPRSAIIPTNLNNDNNLHMSFNALANNNINNSIDKVVLEEIVKKTTNEMVLSLMKSNLLENPHSGKKPIYQDLSKSVEEYNPTASRESGLALTNNFQKKKIEILNQIENIDKEILLMEKRGDVLENSIDKNSVEDHNKNSFLSSPLDLPDHYFKPKLKPKKPVAFTNKTQPKVSKTQSISHTSETRQASARYKSPASSLINKKPALKDKIFDQKVVAVTTNRFNKKKLITGSFNGPSTLKSFEERNRKWLEEREMKIQKSKEKLDGMFKEYTFKPQIFDKKRLNNTLKEKILTSKEKPLISKEKTLTSIHSPKKPTEIITPIKRVNTLKGTTMAAKRSEPKISTINKNLLNNKTLLERRKELTQTDKKQELHKKNNTMTTTSNIPSNFNKKFMKPIVSQVPSSQIKGTSLAFKAKVQSKENTLKPKPRLIKNASEKKSPTTTKKSHNTSRNDTSIEEIFKKKIENSNNNKEEMKELIGVLINLTKTLKEKNNEGSEKTIQPPPFELNIKTVYPDELGKQKILSIQKLEGLDDLEQAITEKTLIEKVNLELMKDDDDDELITLSKNNSLEKYSGLLNKANELTDQIKKVFNSTEQL